MQKYTQNSQTPMKSSQKAHYKSIVQFDTNPFKMYKIYS